MVLCPHFARHFCFKVQFLSFFSSFYQRNIINVGINSIDIVIIIRIRVTINTIIVSFVNGIIERLRTFLFTTVSISDTPTCFRYCDYFCYTNRYSYYNYHYILLKKEIAPSTYISFLPSAYFNKHVKLTFRSEQRVTLNPSNWYLEVFSQKKFLWYQLGLKTQYWKPLMEYKYKNFKYEMY